MSQTTSFKTFAEVGQGPAPDDPFDSVVFLSHTGHRQVSDLGSAPLVNRNLRLMTLPSIRNERDHAEMVDAFKSSLTACDGRVIIHHGAQFGDGPSPRSTLLVSVPIRMTDHLPPASAMAPRSGRFDWNRHFQGGIGYYHPIYPWRNSGALRLGELFSPSVLSAFAAQRFRIHRHLETLATADIGPAHALAHRLLSRHATEVDSRLAACGLQGFSSMWDLFTEINRGDAVTGAQQLSLADAVLDCDPALRSLRLRLLTREKSLEEAAAAAAVILAD